jgi:hypothetical protein
LFNGGKRNRSQLFFAHADCRFSVRLTHKFLIAHLKGYKEADRVPRLENLLRYVWLPRSFITTWLTEYQLLPIPSWLESAFRSGKADNKKAGNTIQPPTVPHQPYKLSSERPSREFTAEVWEVLWEWERKDELQQKKLNEIHKAVNDWFGATQREFISRRTLSRLLGVGK